MSVRITQLVPLPAGWRSVRVYLEDGAPVVEEWPVACLALVTGGEEGDGLYVEPVGAQDGGSYFDVERETDPCLIGYLGPDQTPEVYRDRIDQRIARLRADGGTP